MNLQRWLRQGAKQRAERIEPSLKHGDIQLELERLDAELAVVLAERSLYSDGAFMSRHAEQAASEESELEEVQRYAAKRELHEPDERSMEPFCHRRERV